MNSELYLALLGTEQVVKNFAIKVNVPGSVICELGSKIKSDGSPKQWKWRTPTRAAYTSYPEDSVVPLLREYEIILEKFNRHRHESQVCVMIICKFEEDESPHGFAFSRETIEMLAKFGATLEIDAI